MQINGTSDNRFTEFHTKLYVRLIMYVRMDTNSLGSTNQLLTDICFNLHNVKSLKIVNCKNFVAGQ